MENPLFTEEYLNKLTLAAEKYFTFRVKLLYVRTPLEIREGVAEYALPDNLVDLMAVKYKGNFLTSLNAIPARDRNIISITNKNSRGVPKYFYIKETKYNVIRFYPIPSENVPASPGTIDFSHGISNQCVLHYYAVAGDGLEMPPFLKRRLTKYYVMKYAYQKEGDSQDLKAAKYFDSKLEWAINELMSFARDCAGSRYIYIPERSATKYKVPRPVLPPNFPAR